MERQNTNKPMDPRVPLDKEKIIAMFAELPTMMQVSLLAGLTAGMASASPPTTKPA